MDTSENISRYNQLIVEYLEGSISESDLRDFEAWVAESKAYRELYYQSVEVWLASQASLGTNRDNSAEYQRFCKRINRRSRISLMRNTLRYAAAILVGVVATASIFIFSENLERSAAAERSESVSLAEGSKSHMVLADGSDVWLNSGSTLSYDGLFATENRELTISGEAYFEVAKDSQRPFIVNAGGVRVLVHGTKFNVRAYDKDDYINVSLKEGSVSMTTDYSSDALYLKPAQMFSYDKHDGHVALSRVNAQGIGSWIEGGLFFNESTLLEITEVLSRRFGVTFVFQNPKREALEFYADFNEQLSIESILEVLARGNRFRYERVGDTVTIY